MVPDVREFPERRGEDVMEYFCTLLEAFSSLEDKAFFDCKNVLNFKVNYIPLG